MRYFPLFFDLRGQTVLVVGGGELALRKVSLLVRAGAKITVVAPEILPDLRALDVEFRQRPFEPADLDGARLVIAATSRRAVNRWIAQLAEGRSIPINVVDDREASRFIVPAIIDRDPVLVAVSTAGTSPVLARRLRERLEALIPARYGDFALWLRELRKSAADRLRGTAERRRFFEAIIDGSAAQRFIDGDRRSAERIAQQLLARASQAPPAAGEVVLVGAGPGDPDLLTVKALRALQDADVIFYDRLVAPAILDLARRDAERVCVGKAPQGPSTAQAEINALMIAHARAGRRVVRLKGGDPFIFGRGGEELEALAEAKIAFSAIPGITAASGCATYAGIPLTHRDHARTVSFVTGHADAQGREPDWRALAQPNQTAVFYMGLARIGHIVNRLLVNGAPAARPVALIAQGTTVDQRVVIATLGTIVAAATGVTPPAPALLVVGDVAALHGSLAWFAPNSGHEISQTAS